MQLSREKDIPGINNYGHVSQEKQNNMSLILSSTSTTGKAAAKAPGTSMASDNKAETFPLVKSLAMPSTGLCSGAVIHVKINTDI